MTDKEIIEKIMNEYLKNNKDESFLILEGIQQGRELEREELFNKIKSKRAWLRDYDLIKMEVNIKDKLNRGEFPDDCIVTMKDIEQIFGGQNNDKIDLSNQ